jgi:hypothetical protein
MMVRPFLLVLGYTLFQIGPMLSNFGTYQPVNERSNLLYSGAAAMLLGAPIMAFGPGSNSHDISQPAP